MRSPASVNKFRVFTPLEIMAFILSAAVAFIAMFPDNTLTEHVQMEKNTAVTIKYLNSIVRVNPDNKYKFLLADTCMTAGLYSRALIAVNTIHPENSAVFFRKDLYSLSILEKHEDKNAAIVRQVSALKTSITATLTTAKDPELLALAYTQSLQAKAYFAAALAAGRLSTTAGRTGCTGWGKRLMRMRRTTSLRFPPGSTCSWHWRNRTSGAGGWTLKNLSTYLPRPGITPG